MSKTHARSECTVTIIREILRTEFEENHSEQLEPRLVDDTHYWKLSIPLQDTYMDYTFDIEQTNNILNKRMHIDYISLTPMTMRICYSVLGDENEKQYIPTRGYLLWDEPDMNLLMRDGGKIELSDLSNRGGSSHADENGTMIQERVDFEVPIDIEQVVGVEIDGEIIELKQ